MAIVKCAFLDARGAVIEGVMLPGSASGGDDDAGNDDEMGPEETPPENCAADSQNAEPGTAEELDKLEQVVADALRPLLVTVETQPIDDSALASAADALGVLADGITSGYFPPEIAGAAFVQLNPYRPIPVAAIYDYMARQGRSAEAASIRDVLAQAAVLLRFPILPPGSFRPS